MNKKFKRTLVGLTAFLMAFSAAAIPQFADKIGLSITASAEKYDANGPICYKFNKNGTATLLKHMDSSVTSVTIPSKVTYQGIDYTVTTIGEGVFSDFTFLESVSIPDTVTEIEKSAFSGCTALTSITIPSSVKSIGDYAFSSCAIKNIVIPEGVETIGSQAFERCERLREIVIPGTVTSIGFRAFSYSGITKAVIKDGVTEINKQAFERCYNLETIEIPNSVTKIGSWAFAGCNSLTSLTIPDSVTTIENGAFQGCISLTSITLPKCFYNEVWERTRSNFGIYYTTEVVFSSAHCVSFYSKYVSVTNGDTPVENEAELDDGVELTITVTVPTGMKLNYVKANGVTLTAVSDGTYKFTTSGGAAIVADFIAKEYSLAITRNENATIAVKDEKGNTLEDGVKIKCGDKFKVEATTSAVGYKGVSAGVTNATLGDDGYYTVDDAADGATVTVSAILDDKIFTLKSIPENVKLYKNSLSVVKEDKNNTFKKGDKITIIPRFGYKMDMDPRVCFTNIGCLWTTSDELGCAQYIFTGKETDGEFTLLLDLKKCFMIDMLTIPAHTKLYWRAEVGGDKSAHSAAEIIDYEVTKTTYFYKGYKLVIKIDEGYKVDGDVKVRRAIVSADENGEYIYTFTGDEYNNTFVPVYATVKKASKITSISEGLTVTKGGNPVSANDEVLEGDELTITVGDLGKNKFNRVAANGAVLSANEDGTYTFIVGTSDVTIDAETIDLNGVTTVPVDVVKAIATSNAEVTLEVDDEFSWTIDGSEIDAKDAKAANLSITKTTVTGTSALRGTVGTCFSIKGTNVKSELNINFEATNAGKFANLFKKVDGKLVFVDNVKIDENGAAIGLEVTEKGEYVVMLCEFSDRPGDINNDGTINPIDSLSILKNYIEIEEGENPLVADVNGDGFINAKDAFRVLSNT